MQPYETPLTEDMMKVNYPAIGGGKRFTGLVTNNSTESPLVTVITAVFNGQLHLAECLESVLRQDYPNIEHIVMDGGSKDGTVNILRSYNDKIALWKSEQDHGVYDAWNKALDEAKGEWICFLGADDEFLPGAISTYMALAKDHPNAEYLSSRERWVHPSGYERIRGGPWQWRKFARWNCIAHVGSMHHHSLYSRLGIYDASFGTAADYELLLRAGDSLNAAYTPAITVMMRGGGMTDMRQALMDASRAKILTGRRNRVLATTELLTANIRFVLRPLRRSLGRFFQGN